MPRGSTNGSGQIGSAPGFPSGYTPSQSGYASNGVASRQVLERIQTLSYSATENKLLLDVEVDQTEGSVKTDKVGNITVQNTGATPAFAILAYRLWSAAGTMTATTYHLNYLLKPG